MSSPRFRPSAVVPLRPLSLLTFLLFATDAPGAEKSHRWFRFTPTRLRDSGASNSIQISEFRLKFRGTNLNMAQAVVTNPGGNSPNGEGPTNLTDGQTSTKWLDLQKRALVFQFPQTVSIDSYSFSTANDFADRDPANWRLEGSDDGNTWVLLDEVINGSVPTGRQAATGDFPLGTVVPPYMSFWHPDYLLKWTPAVDTSSDFNRSGVPLAARGNALNVNSNARPNEGKVTVLTTFGPTSFVPSQGSAVEHFNAYTGWQYTDKLVFWGGSAGEGLILAPGGPVIDAAHRNGVPVMGTVFFPPTAYGGQFHWVRTFVQKNGSTFPVADKLIEVCRHYGFDGWFINQETNGGNSTDSADMRDFISYFRSRAPDLQIMWYDAMTESGPVSWQNALTSSNDWFMSHNSQPVAHSMFLNFWWYNSNNLADSRTLAQTLGVNPYSIYAGIDVESAGSGTAADWESVFPTNQRHRTSVAFYGAQSIFRNTGNPGDFQNSELRFWSGANRDPSNTTTGESWKGLAHYVPASSPLRTLPFVTNFNRGQGNRYAVEGETLMTRGWNNLSVQDVLPTWRWIVTSTGTKLTPSLELDDAYSGGTSLRISGTLNATNDVKLYAASLPVSAATKFRMIYKSGQGTGATSMQLALTFEDAPLVPYHFNVGNAGATGWRTIDFDLAAHAGKKIATIGLRFTAGSTINNYQMRIGRMAVFDGAVSPPSPVTNLRLVRKEPLDSDTMALRLKWDASATAGIYYYQVIQRFPDGTRKWLGATPTTAFYVPVARRKNTETALNIEVQAVGGDFGFSTVSSLVVDLPQAPDTTFELTGTWIGTPGAWANGPDTGNKAFDNNLSTFFDAQEESAWTGQDYGSGRAKRITAIRYVPRPGWAYRSLNGVFEAANQADFSDAVNLHVIVTEPADGIYTAFPVVRPELYRYVRYRSNGHGNVAEIKVYGYELPTAPTGLAGTMNSNGAILSWAASTWAKTYKLERAAVSGGPYTVVAENLTTMGFADTAVPAGQQPFYRVTAVNPAGNAVSSPLQLVSPWLTWTSLHFGGETAVAIVGPESDPDGDSIPNLVEYAMGLDPNENIGPVVTTSTDEGVFSIIYQKKTGITDAVLKVQWSDSLGNWTDTGVLHEVISTAGDLQTIRSTVAAGSAAKFLRLQVVRP